MASAPLNWLLKIGGDALNTTAKTITAAVNELNSVLSTLGTRVSKTETDITSIKADTSAITPELNKKVNKVDVLTLEEIEAATDLTNKVAAADTASVLSSRLGGCDFSVEDGTAYVSYNAGTETVKKKLGSGGKLYILGIGRTFNIATIVGSENVGKYTSANFIAVPYGNSLSINATYTLSDKKPSSSSSVSGGTVTYDPSTGTVTIGGFAMSIAIYKYENCSSMLDSKSINLSVAVYFVDTEEIVSV